MNLEPDPLEQTLHSLRRRQPPPEFLEKSLKIALLERSKASGTNLKRRVPWLSLWSQLLALIPRPIRWPLAACWLLALFFHVNTPEAISADTLLVISKMPPPDPAVLIAHIQDTERLAHELLDRLCGPIPPL